MSQPARPRARAPRPPGSLSPRRASGATVLPSPAATAPSPGTPVRLAARSRWRRRLRPLLVAVAVLALAGGAVWAIGFSRLLDARAVGVTGVHRTTTDRVLAAAAVPLGTPLARLDTEGIRAAVARIPQVASVEVGQGWPHTVRIVVRERQPRAVVAGRAGWWLVDAEGVAFQKVSARPGGLPLVQAAPSAPGRAAPPTLRAAIQVVDALPRRLARQVGSVEAQSPDDIRLALPGGRQVRWGSAERSERKAEVLRALLRHRATEYDVSAPEVPTTIG